MDRVGPLHRAMAPSHFTFGSHAAIFKGFLPSVRAAKPLLNSKLAKLFRLAHAGWPGKESEDFQLQGPSIIEGFRRLLLRSRWRWVRISALLGIWLQLVLGLSTGWMW